MMNNIPPKLMNQILTDSKVRTGITKNSFEWFFPVYLPHYLGYPSAPFHEEMFQLIEDEKNQTIIVVAFRGSAKSTIMTLAYPIWSILGKQQKKFVVIVAQTQQQVKLILKNLREELETNVLLKKDLGPFREEKEDGDWSSSTLVLTKYGARITVVSVEQSVRGIKHKQHRPDLIICDDIEDLASVKTIEGRDKVYQFLTGELIPAGDKNTRLVLVGNLLHQDSVLMRVKNDIEQGRFEGVFRSYPLMNADGQSLWPGKYPTPADIYALKMKTGNENAWQREYMLRIVPDEGQVIHPEWINWYDQLPARDLPFLRFEYSAMGIDLAISKKDSADFTAIVVMDVFRNVETRDIQVYVHPYPINKRLTALETLDEVAKLYKILSDSSYTKIYVEEVGYQSAFTELLDKHKNIHATGVVPKGDKRERLALVAHLIQGGKVFFPRQGAKELIDQLVGFGSERHDDLADAFSLLLMKISENNHPSSGIGPILVSGGPRFPDWLSPTRKTVNWRDIIF